MPAYQGSTCGSSCVSLSGMLTLRKTNSEGALSHSQVDGLRSEVERLLLHKIENPTVVLSQNDVVEAMLRLLSHDGF